MIKYLLPILLLLSLLNGCALDPVSVSAPARYTINYQGKAIKTYHLASSHRVFVSSMNADPSYNSPAMIYSYQPNKLERYQRSYWTASPSSLLTAALTKSLRQSNYFSAVTTAPTLSLTNYQINSRLLRLVQNLGGDKPTLSLSMYVEVMNNHNKKIIAHKYFHTTVSMQGVNAYYGAQAANTAANNLLPQVADFCVHVIQ